MGAGPVSDQGILDMAVRLHAFTKPGDWIETEVLGTMCYGQVIEVPDRFPVGEYTLRVLLPKSSKGLDGMESIVVKRLPAAFRNVSSHRPADLPTPNRSEESRVGTQSVRTFRSRWAP